jgi:ACR3 family arsenite efflux pump ArsB
VAEQWRGIAVSVGINWLVKPFSMALLGWLFIGWLAVPAVPAGGADRQLHRRTHYPRGCALHGDGVCLVQPDRWRS